MEIPHFSHPDHTLTLCELSKLEEKPFYCKRGCKVIDGPAYVCRECKFCLHKSCLPGKIPHHPLHPQHPLILSADLDLVDRRPNPYICDACRDVHFNLTYHCALCNFNLDLKCSILNHEASTSTLTLKPHIDKDFIHKHTLKLGNFREEYKDSFYCYSCSEIIEGLAYCCFECLFFLHKSCSEIPQKIDHLYHRHTLFASTLPIGSPVSCRACNYPLGGISLSCKGCFKPFELHVSCSNFKPQQLKHRCHEHDLFYFVKNERLRECCHRCNKGIDGPYYCCMECTIYFHLNCIPIQSKVRLESLDYDHDLILVDPSKEVIPNYHCDVCELEGNPNQHAYRCVECNYTVHIECVVSEKETSLDLQSSLKARIKEEDRKDFNIQERLARGIITTISKEKIVVGLVGLDKAGKTSVVNAIETGGYFENTIPTGGFTLREVTKENCKLEIYDLAGSLRDRANVWERYCRWNSSMVYVVDAADHDKLAYSRMAILDLIRNPSLAGMPLLVIGNKIDKPDSVTKEYLTQLMGLNYITDRKVNCIMTSCKNSSNIASVVDWLVETHSLQIASPSEPMSKDESDQSSYTEDENYQRHESNSEEEEEWSISKQEIEVSLVGLDNAGKTSVVNAIEAGDYFENLVPTAGFTARSVTKENCKLKIWDLGGSLRYRRMWERYCRGVSIIVYVVDAADHDKLPDSRMAILDLIRKPSLAGIPLLVLGNKIDKPDSVTKEYLTQLLGLNSISDRKVGCIMTSCKNSSNIAPVIDWLTASSFEPVSEDEEEQTSYTGDENDQLHHESSVEEEEERDESLLELTSEHNFEDEAEHISQRADENDELRESSSDEESDYDFETLTWTVVAELQELTYKLGVLKARRDRMSKA